MLHDAMLQYFLVCEPGTEQASDFLEHLKPDPTTKEGEDADNSFETWKKLIGVRASNPLPQYRSSLTNITRTLLGLPLRAYYIHVALVSQSTWATASGLVKGGWNEDTLRAF
ncbi:unnamed protein product [Alternaria alternata]